MKNCVKRSDDFDVVQFFDFVDAQSVALGGVRWLISIEEYQ